MMTSYEEIKRELTQLLTLIRQGQATLEDARAKLREPIENERNKVKAELESYRQEIELQLEERRKELVNLAKTYVSGEAKEEIVRLAEEKAHGLPWLGQAYDDMDMKKLDQLIAKYSKEDK